MDTTGFSQVGRYGTISLMKRCDPATVVTAFGIDSDQLTFGRDLGCSVRLYYPDVSLLHCKIIFEDRKVSVFIGVSDVINYHLQTTGISCRAWRERAPRRWV